MEASSKYIFIDNGFDTMKCALMNQNILQEFDYFMVPTYILPHIKQMPGLQFNRAKIQKSMNDFIAKELEDNPYELKNTPAPIYKGKITNLECFTQTWRKVIDQFLQTTDKQEGENDSQYSILMAEPTVNFEDRQEQRAEITQIAFEELGASNFAFASSASLKLFAELKYSGVVVDFGADLTQITPVEEGYASYFSSVAFRVCGNSIDKYLLYTLQLGNKIKPDINDFLTLHCVKQDLKEQDYTMMDSEYELPGGRKIVIDRNTGYDLNALTYLYFNSDIVKELEERFSKTANQQLFSKSQYSISMTKGATKEDKVVDLHNIERKSIVYKVLRCLNNYTMDENINRNQIETILLTGGGLEIGNLKQLVSQQLETKCINDFSKVNVYSQAEPVKQILQGAKIYCSMPHLESILISKSEYNEEGPDIINKKCF